MFLSAKDSYRISAPVATISSKIKDVWEFPDGPVVKTLFPMQRAWIRFLVRELRSHAVGPKKKKKLYIKKIRCSYVS